MERVAEVFQTCLFRERVCLRILLGLRDLWIFLTLSCSWAFCRELFFIGFDTSAASSSVIPG